MVVVTVEMWPKGNRKKKYLLAEAVITNDGKGTKSVASYDCIILDRRGKKVRRVRIEGFQRLRASVWTLIMRMVQQVYGERRLR